jgi:hypothetical protein
VWAAAWFDFFFTVPYDRFTIRSSGDVTTFALLLVVGVAVSQLAAHARRLKVIAITDAGYLAQLHETASVAQAARSPDDVVAYVREQLITLLDLAACRFEHGSLLGHPPRLEPDGTILDGHVRRDVEQSGMPGEDVELRHHRPGHPCRPVSWPSCWPTRPAGRLPHPRPPANTEKPAQAVQKKSQPGTHIGTQVETSST